MGLTGLGTSLALAGAYILAGELATALDDAIDLPDYDALALAQWSMSPAT
ncbi:MAG TPA: hypothetical protein VFO20_05005 [Propionibacteriaceae bacterium]|nr:hypothetical protein [Propionibacteriaceae bacterium]